MAEDINGLLEKIRRDGIEAAEKKAAEIEAEASRRAEDKVRHAGEEAAEMVARAREEITRMEDGAKRSLIQASRDTLISLRQSITMTLEKVAAAHVHKALSADEIARLILVLVKDAGCAGKEKTVVTLRREDLEKVEKPLFAALSAELRKGLVLKHSADIKGGFTISYDSGRSYYDFTDRALAEHIAAHLKPELAKLLEEAAGK